MMNGPSSDGDLTLFQQALPIMNNYKKNINCTQSGREISFKHSIVRNHQYDFNQKKVGLLQLYGSKSNTNCKQMVWLKKSSIGAN